MKLLQNFSDRMDRNKNECECEFLLCEGVIYYESVPILYQ